MNRLAVMSKTFLRCVTVRGSYAPANGPAHNLDRSCTHEEAITENNRTQIRKKRNIEIALLQKEKSSLSTMTLTFEIRFGPHCQLAAHS